MTFLIRTTTKMFAPASNACISNKIERWKINSKQIQEVPIHMAVSMAGGNGAEGAA